MTTKEHNAFPRGRWSSTHHTEPEFPISPLRHAPTDGCAENKPTQCARPAESIPPQNARQLAGAPASAHTDCRTFGENCAPVELVNGAEPAQPGPLPESSAPFREENPDRVLIAGLKRANDSLAREVARVTAERDRFRAAMQVVEPSRDAGTKFLAYHYARVHRHLQALSTGFPLSEVKSNLESLANVAEALAYQAACDIDEQAK